jgi:hypothetical protein
VGESFKEESEFFHKFNIVEWVFYLKKKKNFVESKFIGVAILIGPNLQQKFIGIAFEVHIFMDNQKENHR